MKEKPKEKVFVEDIGDPLFISGAPANLKRGKPCLVKHGLFALFAVSAFALGDLLRAQMGVFAALHSLPLQCTWPWP